MRMDVMVRIRSIQVMLAQLHRALTMLRPTVV